MRFPFITALIAGAALAQVGANPIRLLIITSNQEADIENTNNRDVRFGHAVPHINNHGPVATLAHPAGSGGKVRRPCNSRLRQKSQELSNLFRKVFGLPLVHTTDTTKPPPSAEHEYRILPFVGTPPAFVENVEEHHQDQKEGEHHRHPHPHHHKHHCGGHKHKKPFMKRLHRALTVLGPWEGRAVAFVLGCGIGVLLRMLWVLALVSYRLIKGHKEEEHKYAEVIVAEPYEDRGEAVVFPPTYVYPDEKADAKVATTDALEEAK